MIHRPPKTIDKIQIQTIFSYWKLPYIDCWFILFLLKRLITLSIKNYLFHLHFFFFCLHAICQQIGWLILSSCVNFVPEYSDSFRYQPGNARESSAFFAVTLMHKYQEVKQSEKTVELESGGDTNCNWCTRDSHRGISKENETLKILWKYAILTDYQIPVRRPNLVLSRKKELATNCILPLWQFQ